jgi:hypothetical protein
VAVGVGVELAATLVVLQGSCRIWLIEGRGGGVTGANGFAEKAAGAGAGAGFLMEDALTRLSRFTSAEFSPKNDCGVFFTAPVLAGMVSPRPRKSNGSGDVVFPLFIGAGLVPILFLLVMISNSSRSPKPLNPLLVELKLAVVDGGKLKPIGAGLVSPLVVVTGAHGSTTRFVAGVTVAGDGDDVGAFHGSTVAAGDLGLCGNTGAHGSTVDDVALLVVGTDHGSFWV